jgi:hypothetical protein
MRAVTLDERMEHGRRLIHAARAGHSFADFEIRGIHVAFPGNSPPLNID